MLTFVQKLIGMKFRSIGIILLIMAFVACQNEEKDQRYLITKDQVGGLTSTTKVSELKAVFAEDSVVNTGVNPGRFSSGTEIIVYKKSGEELLRLQPSKAFDSTSTISSIQVIDTIFQTKEGLGRGSNFEILRSNYDISRIENTGRTATIFLDELNIYVTVDKKDIREPTQMGAKIKTSQIKDKAKIRHLWVDWD